MSDDYTCVPGWLVRALILHESARLTLVAREHAAEQYAESVTYLHLLAERTGLDRARTLRPIVRGMTKDVSLHTVDVILLALDLALPTVIDVDRFLIPKQGRRCAALMAADYVRNAGRPAAELDAWTDHFIELRRRAHEEPHDYPYGEPPVGDDGGA